MAVVNRTLSLPFFPESAAYNSIVMRVDSYGGTSMAAFKCSSGRGRTSTWHFVSLNIFRSVEGKCPLSFVRISSKRIKPHSDGAYGLYLDESLFDGSSARCPTFDNEPLCSPGDKRGRAVSFECVGLEVWGIGP